VSLLQAPSGREAWGDKVTFRSGPMTESWGYLQSSLQEGRRNVNPEQSQDEQSQDPRSSY